MSDTIKLSGVTLDCPDARQLAAFHAFYVDDRDATEARVLAAGANKYVQPNNDPLLGLHRPGRARVLPIDLGEARLRRTGQPSHAATRLRLVPSCGSMAESRERIPASRRLRAVARRPGP